MKCLLKYFPTLDGKKLERFEALDGLYRTWNARINVISRKDIDNLYEHHVLHSLGIAEIINFKDGTKVMDLGTGGGFPGIPLAIMFPETEFLLVDSIRKKVMVCQEIARELELDNVSTRWGRAEDVDETFQFVVSRAVMPLADLIKIVRSKISGRQMNGLPNGLICLKGGELERETYPYRSATQVTPLSDYFDEEYFKTKKIVYTQL